MKLNQQIITLCWCRYLEKSSSLETYLEKKIVLAIFLTNFVNDMHNTVYIVLNEINLVK